MASWIRDRVSQAHTGLFNQFSRPKEREQKVRDVTCVANIQLANIVAAKPNKAMDASIFARSILGFHHNLFDRPHYNFAVTFVTK
jgi:hypothetical protein